MANTTVTNVGASETTLDFHALNAMLNLYDDNRQIQFDKDKEAARRYFIDHVNKKTVFFHSLEEKLNYLVTEGYYEEEFLNQYTPEFIKERYKQAYAYKFRFPTFLGAYKYYSSYTLKTFDGENYLERYEDRIVANALYLANGNEERATFLVDELMSGRYQPATPTFLNAGKKARGELVSCFPAGTKVTVESGLLKNIEELRVGDLVLTHTGELKPVTKTIINPNSEPMITIKPANGPPVTMTANHPVLVYNEEEDNREVIIDSELPEGLGYKWVAARDVLVNKDYILTVGQQRREHSTPIYMENYISRLPKRVSSTHGVTATQENYVVHDGHVKYELRDKKYSRRNGRFSTRTFPVKNEIPLNYDFGKFIGYYLAEGHVAIRTNSSVRNSVVFTFGATEDDFIQDVVQLSENLFSVTPTVNLSTKDNSARIAINSVLVAEMVNDLVGSGFGKKALSDYIFNANNDFARGLLVGAFRGDGCTTQSRVIMDLVNPQLIRQLRTLSVNLGLVPGIRDYINQAGNVTTSLYFDAIYPSNHELILEIGKNLHRFQEPAAPRRDFMICINSNEVLSLVVGKNEEEAVETVYNLEVKDNHTYLTEGVVVHNCFLLDTGDSMESISRVHNASLQLSKRGGGVAINLSNLREQGAPIKRIENQSSGVIPVMKMLEDAFSYANQLGARQGAGAVYLNAHHPDILNFLDTRRENADEKIRIKTLSIGVVIPDVTFKLARENEEMYLFSPYDVERIYGKPFSYVNITEEYENMVNNPEIRKKKINARRFFSTIAEVQIQSGYPYVMFEDAVNRGNPLDGRVVMSNLCVTGDTEILTDAGYRNVKELYETQEDFDVIVDTRARDMELANDGLSVEKSTRMHLTATDADILKLTTSDGFTLRATPWHKMYVVKCGSEDFVKISLQEVQPGDRLLVARGEVSGRVDGGESVIRPLHSTKEDGFTTVLSIEHDGVEDVYDVTVENGNSVIFNGIATGNCTEILQTSEPSEYNEDLSYSHVGKDISCNLGSLNIAKVMEGKNIGRTVEEAVRALTVVSEKSNIRSVPSIERGNDMSRAIGLGQMNLHGYLASQEIFYGNEEGLDFTNVYFSIINYASLRASNKLAIEKGDTFEGFETSTYADGSYFERYVERPVTPRTDKVAGLFEDIHVPTSEDWIELRDSVMKHGLYNAYRLAVAPTGSISYISHSTSSIHPITSEVEIRREGSIGRVYYPAYGLTNQNREYYEDAYEIGWKRLIDTYAVASRHTDQGLSLTLFFNEGTTTREVNRAQMYAWKKGIKTLYYIRTKQMAIAGTDMEDCVSCAI